MGPDPLRTGANALRYWEERQQVVSHNLANSDTHGFKAERVFARLLGDTIATQAATDMRAGALTPTDSPLDLGVEGDGYFVVQTTAGERLTRSGSFRLDSEGQITDASGNPLLGAEGVIVVRGGALEIDDSGAVRVDGIEIERIRIVRPADGAGLTHEDGVRFRVDGETVDVTDGVRVRQGYLERSNVDALQSMIEMIGIQRSYAAVQNSIRTMDGVMDRIANSLSRLS